MARTTLGRGAEDLVVWLQHIPDLHRYADMFEKAGTTGELLVAINSDTELIDLGMKREIDRKCLLLQLARVRARNATLTGCHVALESLDGEEVMSAGAHARLEWHDITDISSRSHGTRSRGAPYSIRGYIRGDETANSVSGLPHMHSSRLNRSH